VWQFQGSLALSLLVALAAGALASFFASLPAIIRGRLTLRSQRKKITELEASLSDHKARLAQAQQRLAELEKPPAPESPTSSSQGAQPPAQGSRE
jgi:hypothetical protein